MSEVISLAERRQKRSAEEHARALVIFECAAALARQAHPGLLRLIEQSYGHEWLATRVQETLTPRRRRDATPLLERPAR